MKMNGVLTRTSFSDKIMRLLHTADNIFNSDHEIFLNYATTRLCNIVKTDSWVF